MKVWRLRMGEDIDIIEDAEILEDPAAVADATEEFFARKAEEGTDVSPIDAAVALSESAKTGSEALVPAGSMAVGDCRFGVKATGEPLRKAHWLADSSVCGDLVMALPSSVLIAGRTAEAGGVAVRGREVDILDRAVLASEAGLGGDEA